MIDLNKTAACKYCMYYNIVNVKQFHGLIYMLQPIVSTRLIADMLMHRLFIIHLLLCCVVRRSGASQAFTDIDSLIRQCALIVFLPYTGHICLSSKITQSYIYILLCMSKCRLIWNRDVR